MTVVFGVTLVKVFRTAAQHIEFKVIANDGHKSVKIKPAGAGVVAGLLRPYIRVDRGFRRTAVKPDRSAFKAVLVVLLRAAAKIGEGSAAGNPGPETKTGELYVFCAAAFQGGVNLKLSAGTP